MYSYKNICCSSCFVSLKLIVCLAWALFVWVPVYVNFFMTLESCFLCRQLARLWYMANFSIMLFMLRGQISLRKQACWHAYLHLRIYILIFFYLLGYSFVFHIHVIHAHNIIGIICEKQDSQYSRLPVFSSWQDADCPFLTESMSGTSPCCTGTPVWQLIKSESVESRQLKKERGTINWGWQRYQTPVCLTFKSTLTLEWPHKQVWNKNCCAPLDAAALMGSRSISQPAFSFRFFSVLFLNLSLFTGAQLLHVPQSRGSKMKKKELKEVDWQ